MDTTLLNMLHHTTDHHDVTIADRINIQLNRVIQEVIQQYRRFVRNTHCFVEVTTQVDFVRNDFHRTATQYIRWTHNQRITDLFCFLYRFFQRSDCRVLWLFQTQTLNRLLEAFTVFSTVDRIRTGTDDWYASRFQCTRQFQRSLTTILNDHTFRLFYAHDFQHVFQCDWFEIQTV